MNTEKGSSKISVPAVIIFIIAYIALTLISIGVNARAIPVIRQSAATQIPSGTEATQ